MAKNREPVTPGADKAASPLTHQADYIGHGLYVGDEVRWQRRDGGQWYVLKVVAIEKDNSIGGYDQRGAFRAVRPEVVEVRRKGPRGGTAWERIV